MTGPLSGILHPADCFIGEGFLAFVRGAIYHIVSA